MIPDPSVVAHVGHSHVTFAQYLFRVGLYLLAFAAVGAVAHWCAGALGSAGHESADDLDHESADEMGLGTDAEQVTNTGLAGETADRGPTGTGSDDV